MDDMGNEGRQRDGKDSMGAKRMSGREADETNGIKCSAVDSVSNGTERHLCGREGMECAGKTERISRERTAGRGMRARELRGYEEKRLAETDGTEQNGKAAGGMHGENDETKYGERKRKGMYSNREDGMR